MSSAAKDSAVAITWRAGRDQIGHALPRRVVGTTRYLCNRMSIAERYAWPIRERCAVCVVKLAVAHG